jgi:DNA-binding NarL/FixJ family response regulator
MKPIKIMLVEDYKLIRVGIKSIFDESNDFEVISEACCAHDALLKAQNLVPDVILLDLGLPDKSGIELIEKLNQLNINSKIVVLSAHNNEDEIKKCLSLGIYSYILKDINVDELLNIVKSVNNGAMWFDSKIVPIIRNKEIIPEKISRKSFKNSHFNLTQREYEVLKLVVDGKSNNQIAKELCISEHTAKAHVCNIIQKLLVDDRTQVAVKAIKEGIIK